MVIIATLLCVGWVEANGDWKYVLVGNDRMLSVNGGNKLDNNDDMM